MYWGLLTQLMSQRYSETLRSLASQVAAGDISVLPILHDCLHEGELTLDKIEIGKAYFIRTLSLYYTGRVISVSLSGIQLCEAAWIPDTGRFSDTMRTGIFSEVEPYPDNMHPIISTATFVEAVEWPHPLPREKK